MTRSRDHDGEFERRARELLAESTRRLDARVRSRLTRARYAALEEAHRGRGPAAARLLGVRRWATAGGLAAVMLLAVMLWSGRPGGGLTGLGELQSALEDIELLADSETFELLAEGDDAFYEWALAEAAVSGGAADS